jgi:hypothetical protein
MTPEQIESASIALKDLSFLEKNLNKLSKIDNINEINDLIKILEYNVSKDKKFTTHIISPIKSIIVKYLELQIEFAKQDCIDKGIEFK